VFPLSFGAAVCGFHVIINDRIVQGVVQPKSKAKANYLAAVARGDGAYLLEQIDPEIFQMSIGARNKLCLIMLPLFVSGNVPPNTAVTLTVRYVQELLVEGPNFRFVLPSSILSPCKTKEQTINVNIECANRIVSITSPSHAEFVVSHNVNEYQGTMSVDLSQRKEVALLILHYHSRAS